MKLSDLPPGTRFRLRDVDRVFVYRGPSMRAAVGICDVEHEWRATAVLRLSSTVEPLEPVPEPPPEAA